MSKQQIDSLFDTFLSNFNNKFIKVLPNDFSPQCFDQAVKWTDILGVPHAPGNPSPFPYANAYEIYTKYGSFQQKYFDRIPNTPDYIPQKGDIVMWAGSLNGGIGHVAVATGEGDTNTFQSFSQNYPLGSNAHLIRTNYNHVLGALRYKVTNSGSTPTPPKNTMETKKAVQVDKIASWLKDQGYAQDAGTEQYFNNEQDPDKFLNKIKTVIRDVSQAQVDVEAIKKEAYSNAIKDVQLVVDKLKR